MCLNIFKFPDVFTAERNAAILNELDQDGWTYCVEEFPGGVVKIKVYDASRELLGYI